MNIAFVKDIVEREYNLKVENIEKIKNVYRIETLENMYCLKIIKYEFGHFLFIYNAMKHLQNNGFKKIPEFIINNEGKEFIKILNKHAYLTPWVNARICNYDNPIDVINATLKLAELHNKSLGFRVTREMKPRIGWLKWGKVYNTRKNEIIDFKNRIDKKEKKSEVDYMYLNMMEEELNRCDKAIENLKKSDYIDKMKEEIKRRGFCHHDYANHNILIETNGDINIIDFDYCMLDTHLHDLASLLIRRMKYGKWSLENAKQILETYNSVNKLYTSDIQVMAAFMEFPQDYWQRGIQIYWEKQPWGEEFFINKLKRIKGDKDYRQEFIEEFRNIKL